MLMAYPSIDKKASYPAMAPYAETVEEIDAITETMDFLENKE